MTVESSQMGGDRAPRRKQLPILDGRLSRVADLLPASFSRLIDVGTDHARLPLYMVRDGRARSALAVDIRSGPLRVAGRNIARLGMESLVKTQLGDGLRGIDLREGDCVVIAGMGGLEILSILDEVASRGSTDVVFVLQPMKSLPELRRGVIQLGFEIVDEQLSFEGRYHYPLLKLILPDGIGSADDPNREDRKLSDLEAHVGPILFDRSRHDAHTASLWPDYIHKLAKRMATIAAGSGRLEHIRLVHELKGLEAEVSSSDRAGGQPMGETIVRD
ncbi:MAG: class I SAM-dependent methyltransferase [Fastidiosipilaceae bacterium]